MSFGHLVQRWYCACWVKQHHHNQPKYAQNCWICTGKQQGTVFYKISTVVATSGVTITIIQTRFLGPLWVLLKSQVYLVTRLLRPIWYKSHTPDSILLLKLTWWLVVLITINTRYQPGTNPRIADTHFKKEIGGWTLIRQCLIAKWQTPSLHLPDPDHIQCQRCHYFSLDSGRWDGNIQILRWTSRNYWSGKSSWQDAHLWISGSSTPQTRQQLWMELTPHPGSLCAPSH